MDLYVFTYSQIRVKTLQDFAGINVRRFLTIYLRPLKIPLPRNHSSISSVFCVPNSWEPVFVRDQHDGEPSWRLLVELDERNWGDLRRGLVSRMTVASRWVTR